MENTDWTTGISIVVASFGVIFSIFSIISKIKLNNQLEKKIADSQLEKSIEKLIRIRNANSKDKTRRLSEKEIKSMIDKLEKISKELDVVKRKNFESVWEIKTQKDKLNYLVKLIQESKHNSDFEKVETLK